MRRKRNKIWESKALLLETNRRPCPASIFGDELWFIDIEPLPPPIQQQWPYSWNGIICGGENVYSALISTNNVIIPEWTVWTWLISAIQSYNLDYNIQPYSLFCCNTIHETFWKKKFLSCGYTMHFPLKMGNKPWECEKWNTGLVWSPCAILYHLVIYLWVCVHLLNRLTWCLIFFSFSSNLLR